MHRRDNKRYRCELYTQRLSKMSCALFIPSSPSALSFPLSLSLTLTHMHTQTLINVSSLLELQIRQQGVISETLAVGHH